MGDAVLAKACYDEAKEQGIKAVSAALFFASQYAGIKDAGEW